MIYSLIHRRHVHTLDFGLFIVDVSSAQLGSCAIVSKQFMKDFASSNDLIVQMCESR